MTDAQLHLKQRGKRLYEMTVPELEEQAQMYERDGNQMWATLCREQISLNYRIAEAFRRKCQHG